MIDLFLSSKDLAAHKMQVTQIIIEGKIDFDHKFNVVIIAAF
jgi:hypothetical protein